MTTDSTERNDIADGLREDYSDGEGSQERQHRTEPVPAIEKEPRAVRRAKFFHPYTPYDVQLAFMAELYACLEQGQVGVFESPTGTGKSLSILCGALTWLREHKRREFDGDEAAGDPDDPPWILASALAARKEDARRRQQEAEKRLSEIRNAERRRRRREPARVARRRREAGGGAEEKEEREFELAEYDSDGGAAVPGTAAAVEAGGMSAESRRLLEKLGLVRTEGRGGEEGEDGGGVRLIYASRTHSQLAQFVGEARRVDIEPVVLGEGDEEGLGESVRVLTFGSRKNLCVNESVQKLGSVAAMNERCLEMQKGKKGKGKGKDEKAGSACEFLDTDDGSDKNVRFQEHVYAQIRDIEEIASLGAEIGICPYYASRKSAARAEVIAVPYPLLLQKEAREALALPVRDAVVIVDEAHNLMDAIASVHQARLSTDDVVTAKRQLGVYLKRFGRRLSGKNKVYITQTVRLLNSVLAAMRAVGEAEGAPAGGELAVGDLLAGDGVDQINMFKLSQYLTESKLARKLEGYADYLDEAESRSLAPAQNAHAHRQPAKARTVAPPVLLAAQQFFLALMNPSGEGRFFYSVNRGGGGGGGVDGDGAGGVRVAVRYVLIDPMYAFRSVVEEARSVVLAGGTMAPFDDYTSLLFPYLPAEKTRVVSCGHVIPPENIAAWAVGAARLGGETGPDVPLEYTFRHRSGRDLIAATGRMLCAIARRVPDGLVAFFPSYDYAAECVAGWKAAAFAAGGDGTGPTIFETLDRIKTVFAEEKMSEEQRQKSGGGGGPSPLEGYSARLNGGQPAMLLAVIGGSLSEGINFSDHLGRCIVIVGLPYPNHRTPEWQAKLKYISGNAMKKARDEGLSEKEAAAVASRASAGFFENTAIRAVNQAVGRAVRHKNDYAAVVLLDQRYQTKLPKLPSWMGVRVDESGRAVRGDVVLKGLETFFGQRQR